MRFGLLGELKVEGEGGPVTIAAPKQRALLALLLVHRGRPVSVDRLAADLWGDDPPSGAIKTVQVYVAQLRKVVGDGVLLTRGRSYLVDLQEHEFDVDRFEQLAAEGRRLLAAGDAPAARSVLREALGLWRGPALADFAYEDFAQGEIARLDEERLAALEGRIEADLHEGSDEALVGEIASLVRQHPLRERLSGHLMVALYRTGRQAEALEAYREARRVLHDELGLEPSPALQRLERAILEQEETLGPVRPVLGPVRAGARRGGRLVLAGGALLITAAAAAVAVALTRAGGGGIALPLPANSVAALDPASGRVVGDFPVGANPAALSVDASGVWVLSADDKTVSRIDPRSGSVRTIGVGALPTDVVAGAGSVWIGTGGRFDQATFAGWVATAIVRMNNRTGALEQTLALPYGGQFVSNAAAQHLAVARGQVWAIAPDARLVRIDPRTGRVKRIKTGSVPVALAADGRAIWLLNEDSSVLRIGAGDRVTARVRVPAPGLNAIAVGDDSVWVTSPDGGVLWRIDPGLPAVQRTIDTGLGTDSVAVGAGFVWVGNSLNGTLSRIDPATNRVDRTIPLGNSPTAVGVGRGRVWVAVAGGSGAATTTHLGAIEPLAETFCSEPVAGEGLPRLLVVSDLPLQGGPRFPSAQMSDAIRFVLRKHGFRAGRYALAYQSCDDSTARTGLFDFAKCAANARVYVANPAVIGVVGPYNSGCAYAQLPVTNHARLGFVSPTTSDVGLTRAAVGAPRGALRSLYPSGVRTYTRLIAADDVQSAAMAVFARRLGAHRIYVLYDNTIGPAYAYYFRHAAQRLGLRVVGFAGWDPKHLAPGALAGKVRGARADAVYICGLTDTGVGAVLAAVRRAIGSRAPMLGCSGLLPSVILFRSAGTSARGTFVSLELIPAAALDATGRTFLHDFAATQAGRPINDAAVYAAQATEVLVRAIAHSDGTRASVARELMRTRIRDGLLGSFQISATGDSLPARTAIVRLVTPGRSNAIQSYDGARIVGVIAPPRRLLTGP